jgi:hypothetical protein
MLAQVNISKENDLAGKHIWKSFRWGLWGRGASCTGGE